jgi:sugar-specific transcriptional regulator TrmB
MVYEVINKLIDRGAAYTIPSDPLKYTPVPAKELLKRVRRNLDATFDFLDQSLSSLNQVEDINVISHINGYDSVINELIGIVDEAKQELWLSVWDPQAVLLAENVQAALSREVNVLSIVFGSGDSRLGTTFHHDYMPPDVVQQRIGGKLTIIVRDKEEVIIANFQDKGTSWAVKTHDPALVLIATEFIRHDIMIEAITRQFGPEQLDKLWRNRPDLRYVVEGRRSE